MPWGIAAAAVGAIGGAVISGNAAKSAANTQADAATQASANQLEATKEGNQLSADIYNKTQQNASPYLQAGGSALAALQNGFGLYGAGGYPTTSTDGTKRTIQGGATTTPAISTNNGYNPATGQYGVVPGSIGTPTAGGTGTGTTGTGGLSGMIDQTNYGASDQQMSTAAGAVGAGQFTKPFTATDLSIDPSYQWRLDQGNQALAASAAARGLTGSGQNLKDIVNYSQGAASQEYQNAYNRNMANNQFIVSGLQNLAGIGQATQAGQAANGLSTASQISNNLTAGTSAANNYTTSGAAASAAGQVGSANAYSGALSGLGNTAAQYQYMNQFKPSTPASTGTNELYYGSSDPSVAYGEGYGPT
jgi:hypothetical protein